MQSLYDLFAPSQVTTYYDTIAVTFLGVNGGQAIPLVQGDSRRVAIIVGTSNSPAFIAPNTTLIAGADSTVQQGFKLNTTVNPFAITYDEFGPLVSQPWTVANPVGVATVARVTVVEIVMLQNAFRELNRETFESDIRSGSSANGVTSNPRAKSQSLWDMVFRACRSKGNSAERPRRGAWPRA